MVVDDTWSCNWIGPPGYNTLIMLDLSLGTYCTPFIIYQLRICPLRHTGILMLQTFDVNGDSKTYIGDAPENLIQDHQDHQGGRIIRYHILHEYYVSILSTKIDLSHFMCFGT